MVVWQLEQEQEVKSEPVVVPFAPVASDALVTEVVVVDESATGAVAMVVDDAPDEGAAPAQAASDVVPYIEAQEVGTGSNPIPMDTAPDADATEHKTV
jgi:hypothetical protein